jgi:hypothetical protein
MPEHLVTQSRDRSESIGGLIAQATMRALLVLFCAALSFLPAAARAQSPQYNQSELDGLLAPVALYPDPVLSQVLAAAVAPDQIAEAAQWTRMNRGMTGDDALRAVQDRGWQPAVAALVAYPELLERMADSPQWTFDLGNAYLAQQGEVMATVQALRQRAYASGSLQSDAQQTVQYYGSYVAVLPAVPNVYYVRYYDPFVVYGPAWRPAYRPVYWRPWAPRPVFVTKNVFVAPRNVAVQPYHRVPEANRQPIVQSRTAPPVFRNPVPFRNSAPFQNSQLQGNVVVQPYHRVPEANRQPIVQSHVAPAFPQQQRHEQRGDSRRDTARQQQRSGRS